MRLVVPRTHRAAFEKLAQLSPEEFKSLHEVLVQPLGGRSRSQVIGAIPDAVDSYSDQDAFLLADSLTALHFTAESHGRSTDEVVQNLGTSENLNLATAERAALQDRIRTLEQESLIPLLTKIAEVVGSRERLLHSVRIISDVRPLFDEDQISQPQRAAITHTLELDVHEAGKRQSMFVALDTIDLAKLADAVSRALDKQESLEAWLRSVGIESVDYWTD